MRRTTPCTEKAGRDAKNIQDGSFLRGAVVEVPRLRCPYVEGRVPALSPFMAGLGQRRGLIPGRWVR